MDLNEAKRILKNHGFIAKKHHDHQQINEIFGFSKEEKEKKLKKDIVDSLSKKKISLAEDISLREENGVYSIYASVAAYHDHEFDRKLTVHVYYFVKSKYVKPANSESVRKEWQKLEIKTTPGSAIAAMIQHIVQQNIRRKEERDEEYEAQRKLEIARDEEINKERRRYGEFQAGRESLDKYGDYHHQI